MDTQLEKNVNVEKDSHGEMDIDFENYIYSRREKAINQHFHNIFREMREWEKRAPESIG